MDSRNDDLPLTAIISLTKEQSLSCVNSKLEQLIHLASILISRNHLFQEIFSTKLTEKIKISHINLLILLTLTLLNINPYSAEY